MNMYINGLGYISPFKGNRLSEISDDTIPLTENGYLKCSEPDYKQQINPAVSRRMSRAVKMGIFTAKSCLSDAGIEVPDAIVTGTGLGCIEDTEKFLISVINNKETLLSPSPFIQSTHNTVSSQIAVMLKCHGYNVTYSHRALSFESAIIDASMLLDEGNAQNILMGGIDEITEISLQLQQRMSIYKNNNSKDFSFTGNKTRGSIAGEGATFFTVAKHPSANSYAKIASLKMLNEQHDFDSINKSAELFLAENGFECSDVDLVILGYSGNVQSDSLYDFLDSGIFKNKALAYFKHLCGEYHTASAFSTALAATILKNQAIPELVRLNKVSANSIKNVLIYNHFHNANHSFLLLTNV